MLNLECSKLDVHIIKLYEKQHHMVEQTALLSLRKHYEAEVCLLPKQLIFFLRVTPVIGNLSVRCGTCKRWISREACGSTMCFISLGTVFL